MSLPSFSRLPKHIAIIPDGNRRWAQQHGMGKEAGYAFGITPGLALFDLCEALGIEEISAYGFTHDNTKRPSIQREAFQNACVDVVNQIAQKNVALKVVGNAESPLFPEALRPFTQRQVFGNGSVRANLLVNYDWHWDISQALRNEQLTGNTRRSLMEAIGSADVSRIDLVIRWGGRRRLSGMLPIQTVYADFYVVDALWPDFHPDHLIEALRWYESQDITLGG